MRVDIIRLEEGEMGSFGALSIEGKAFCVTLELPDRNNRKNISNIPEGVYLCKKINSPTFGLTFQIMDIPNRSSILFHAGNFIDDTKGCVILAEHYGKLHGERAVLNSGNTFKKFMSLMHEVDSFALKIQTINRG